MNNNILIMIIIYIAMMTSCSEYTELGNGYVLGYNGMRDVSLEKCLKEGSAPTVLILGHILDYAVDATFILAAERPRNSVPECTGTIPGMTLDRCDEAFKRSTFRQYWIVNKNEKVEFDVATRSYSNVYGPFNKEEYLQMRYELGVPEELRLKEES